MQEFFSTVEKAIQAIYVSEAFLYNKAIQFLLIVPANYFQNMYMVEANDGRINNEGYIFPNVLCPFSSS